MHQGTREYQRRGGGLVNLTQDTVTKLRFVKQALRLRDYDLEVRLGLPVSSLSRILRYKQTRVTQTIHNIYYPRLQTLMEQADRSGGVPAVQDQAVNSLNPPSTPEAKDFLLGPYREKVAQRSALGRTPEWRKNHREAMRRHWDKRRALKKAKEAPLVPGRMVMVDSHGRLYNPPVFAEAESASGAVVQVEKMPRPGLFTRLFRALFP